MRSGGNDAQIIPADVNEITWMELPAAPQLGLTIDGHLAAGDQELGVRSARGDSRKLQRLAKADHVAGDFDRSLHTESVPDRSGWLAKASSSGARSLSDIGGGLRLAPWEIGLRRSGSLCPGIRREAEP
jgi:hypothetical protein